MKKYYFLPVLLFLNANQVFAQSKGPYIFPVKPGTEEWKKLPTGRAMVEVTQIPLLVLSQMNTEDLVTTCLSYPLLSNILAYNDLQEGYQAIANDFNGLQELLKRPDAAREIFKRYSKMDPNAVETKSSNLEKGKFTFEFTYIELLLAQPSLLEKLTAAERKQLSKEGFVKFKAKDAHLDTFSGFGEITSVLVLGRILEKESFSAAYQTGTRSAAMRTFLSSGKVTNPQIVNQIVADTQTFAK